MNQIFKNFLTTFFVIFGFVSILWLFTFTSYAQSLPVEVTDSLPYPIEDFQTVYENWIIPGFGYDYYNCDWSSGNIIGFVSPSPPDTTFINYNLLVPKSNGSFAINLNNVPYQTFDSDINYLTLELTNYNSILYRTYSDGRFEVYGINRDGNFSENFLGNYSVPNYISNNISYDDNNYFVLSSSVEIISGSTVAPLFTGLSGGDIANGINILPLKPSINTYNPPTFTSSSIIDSLNSIYDIVEYNLTYSTSLIVDYFDYFSSLIQYGFKSIIDNIQNGIQNIYDNFNSLFSPILNGIAEKISYIVEPVDSQTITQGIGNYEIFTDINAFKLIHDDFEDMVNNTSEPESFLIPVHIEKISYFSDVPTQYIDLQVLHDLPVLKPFCWVVVSVGLVLIVASGLPQMLYGGDANGK